MNLFKTVLEHNSGPRSAWRRTQKITPNHQSRLSRGGGVREIVTAGAERAAAVRAPHFLGLGTVGAALQAIYSTVGAGNSFIL